MMEGTSISKIKLTSRWYPLRYHEEQVRRWRSRSRFVINPSGRRSGKTELEKRLLVIRAMLAHEEINFPPPYNFFAAAPTRDQAKRIYWNDLKSMVPKEFWAREPVASHLIIPLINGANISVIGMDKPERVEGSPWDGGILDEYGNMKKRTWGEHVRPALADRRGWCSFIGVPEGRNHYYDLYKRAKESVDPDWDVFWWPSEDILPAEEIEAARRELDELTFEQEFRGSFVNYTGRAYYNFDEERNCCKLEYNPRGDLIFMFDFNVSPGVAVVAQEMCALHPKTRNPILRPDGTPAYYMTGIIGEVHIPRNSNTEMVCNKLIHDWGKHQGRVFCYGDATGGSKGSAKIMGSDWSLIRQKLHPVFGNRLFFDVTRANPPERDRVNAVNTRLKNFSGQTKLMVDPGKAPKLVKDFEGTVVVKGGSGEIDKKEDPTLTHMTDAVGYYVERCYPVVERHATCQEI